MQWSMPRPRDPWPHDMVITVDDHPLCLNLLLLVRAPFWTRDYDGDGLDRDAFIDWRRDLSPPAPHDAARKSAVSAVSPKDPTPYSTARRVTAP